MIDSLLALIAPHHCCGCGKISTLLCDNCKYDITSEPFLRCLNCNSRLVAGEGLCGRCRPSYTRAWCVGTRENTLETLINCYKFERVRAADRSLAALLDEVLPLLPQETVVVPVPTVASHMRVRGYDHIERLARRLARARSLTMCQALQRVTNTTQRGTSARERRKQAKEAFKCTKSLAGDIPYLLIDDVMTTGATLEYAARTLKVAGATEVWVAVLSHQPLD